MKRMIFLWVVLLMFAGPILAAGEEAVFRNVRWGMSMNEVEEAETLTGAYRDGENLGYQTTAEGFDCVLVYRFHHDQLIAAGYSFSHAHGNPMEFVRDFETVKKRLIQRYGDPFTNDVDWKNERYRYVPDKWGSAILAGDLDMITTWLLEEKMVSLELTGENNRPVFTLVYMDKKLLESSGRELEEENPE